MRTRTCAYQGIRNVSFSKNCLLVVYFCAYVKPFMFLRPNFVKKCCFAHCYLGIKQYASNWKPFFFHENLSFFPLINRKMLGSYFSLLVALKMAASLQNSSLSWNVFGKMITYNNAFNVQGNTSSTILPDSKCVICNCRTNIWRLFHVFTQFLFTTGEMKLDYYH